MPQLGGGLGVVPGGLVPCSLPLAPCARLGLECSPTCVRQPRLFICPERQGTWGCGCFLPFPLDLVIFTWLARHMRFLFLYLFIKTSIKAL